MGFFVDFWDALYYNNWLATCCTRVKYRTKIQAIPLISMIGVASCCDSQTILKWQKKMHEEWAIAKKRKKGSKTGTLGYTDIGAVQKTVCSIVEAIRNSVGKL